MYFTFESKERMRSEWMRYIDLYIVLFLANGKGASFIDGINITQFRMSYFLQNGIQTVIVFLF